MFIFEQINVNTPKREVLVDISNEVKSLVRKSGIKEGTCRIFIPHTTAGITINENADPAVKKDIILCLKKLIPIRTDFSHIEENSDAHIKSSLIGSTLELILHKGKVLLGTWQGILFAEFDGPRNRKIYIQIQGIR